MTIAVEWDVKQHNKQINKQSNHPELIDLLSLPSWCFAIVVWLFLAVSLVCMQFVIVVDPDHTHQLFLNTCMLRIRGFALFVIN